MTLKEAEKRIAQLETLVRELQSRPTIVHHHHHAYSPLLRQPERRDPCMPPYEITCSTVTDPNYLVGASFTS